MKKRIAHFGAFDHDSYGDLLFPFVAEHFLGNEFELVHVAPTGGQTPWPDQPATISVDEALNRDDWDGVLIGGGDIIQGEEWTPEQWQDDSILSMAALPSLWIGGSLLAARLNIPLAWCAPGVPKPINQHFQTAATVALKGVDYLSVRDEYSKGNLGRITDQLIAVVPDTAISLNQVWPIEPSDQDTPYFAVCFSTADLHDKLEQIDSALTSLVRQSPTASVKAVPLMLWQQTEGAYHHPVATLLEGKVCALDRDLSLKQCAQMIGQSAGYIGNSLHGLVTAISYQVPGVIVVPSNAPQAHKYAGFIESLGLEPAVHICHDWNDAPALIEKQKGALPPQYSPAIANHWSRISAVLSAAAPQKAHLWADLCDIATQQTLSL